MPGAWAASIPDAGVTVATAWQTAEPVTALPASQGAEFYLIQHHETRNCLADGVDAPWRLPVRKVVI